MRQLMGINGETFLARRRLVVNEFSRAEKQNESCLNESIYQDSWREKRKEPAEKTNNFERFFGD